MPQIEFLGGKREELDWQSFIHVHGCIPQQKWVLRERS
jgi:hypothetical protein